MKIVPTTHEVSFSAREMFFSETDAKGTILSSNEVFERVSGYGTGQLNGKPHNIIRHPDMPKSVFRMMWDSILAGKPIAAYVKNMAANGDYYWVLADVFPKEGGFVSIRVKPTSPLPSSVEEIYAATRDIEKLEGIEKGVAYLESRVCALGYASYQLFTVTALNTELSARVEAVAKEGASPLHSDGKPNNSLEQIRKSAVKFSLDYQSVTDRIAPILATQLKAGDATSAITLAYRDIKHVAVNMMADIEHIGEQARTLAVIARTFKACSDETLDAVSKLGDAVGEMNKTIQAASFVIASARMQVEMLTFYVSEIQDNILRDPTYDPSSGIKLFAGLCQQALEVVTAQIADMERRVQGALPWVATLADSVAALYFVRQNGRMEVARLDGGQDLFGPQLNAMNTFMIIAKREGANVRTALEELNGEIGSIRHTINGIDLNLSL